MNANNWAWFFTSLTHCNTNQVVEVAFPYWLWCKRFLTKPLAFAITWIHPPPLYVQAPPHSHHHHTLDYRFGSKALIAGLHDKELPWNADGCWIYWICNCCIRHGFSIHNLFVGLPTWMRMLWLREVGLHLPWLHTTSLHAIRLWQLHKVWMVPTHMLLACELLYCLRLQGFQSRVFFQTMLHPRPSKMHMKLQQPLDIIQKKHRKDNRWTLVLLFFLHKYSSFSFNANWMKMPISSHFVFHYISHMKATWSKLPIVHPM